jgi:carboxymethylenebutenolidase
MISTTIATPHHDLEACLDVPEGAGPWPGVVIIHDVFGMGEDLRRQAAWLATAGYLAVAPNFFSWGGKLQCVRATFRDLKERRGRAFDDLDAARSWLTRRSDCRGRVG